MAARRVSLGYLATSVLLSVGAAVATFQLKYAVRNVEGELAKVAGADRAGARRPAIGSRGPRLSHPPGPAGHAGGAAGHGLRSRRPLCWRPAQIPGWDELQWARVPVQAMLPSGAGVELRSKPLPVMAGLGLGLD